MATTQSISNQNLTTDVTEDDMDIGTSPYLELDVEDVELDLDDDPEHSIADNSMIDDTADNLDSMQADDPVSNHDDDMWDEEIQEDTFAFVEDQEMNPDEYDPDQYEPVDAPQQIQTHPHDPTTVTEYPDQELEEENTVNQQEIETEEMGEDTNLDPTSANTTPRPQPDYELNNREHQHSPMKSLDNAILKDPSIAVVDLAHEPASLHETTASQNDETEPAVADELDRTEAESEQGRASEHLEQNGYPLDDDDVLGGIYEENVQDNVEQLSHSHDSTSVPLHPVTVQYLEEDMSLFPPYVSDDGRKVLLHDLTLVTRPIEDLLLACRMAIEDENNEGWDLLHDDEIILEIPSLGLHFCQDSKYVSQITLAQVLDTYMLLAQNENLSPIQPLYCVLSHRVCVKTQLAWLQEQAQGDIKAKYSYIASLHTTSPDPEAFAQDQNQEYSANTSTHFDAAVDLEDQSKGGADATGASEQHMPTEPEYEETETSGRVAEDVAEDFDAFDALDNTEDTSAAQDHVIQGDAQLAVSQVEPFTDSGAIIAADNNDASHSSPTDTINGVDSVRPDQTAAKVTEGNVTLSEHEHEHIQGYGEAAEAEDLQEDLFADDEPESVSVEVEESANGHHEPEADVHDKIAPSTVPVEEEELTWSDDEEGSNGHDAEHKLTTPSKQSNGKRKLAEDDEDLFDLDDTTPITKRTRPS